MAKKNSGNHKGPEKPNQNNVPKNDMLSGIRRVSADSILSASSNPSNMPKGKTANRSPNADKKPGINPKAKPVVKSSAQPMTKRVQQESAKTVSDKKKNVLTSANSKSVEKGSEIRQAPITAKRIPAHNRKNNIRRRKIIAAFLVIFMILLIAVFVCFGIYHFYRFISRRSFNQPESMINSMLEVTYVTTTETTTVTTTESTAEPTSTPTPAPTPFPVGGPDLSGYRIVLDAGHQEKPNLEPEALSRSMGGSKDKSSQGFVGVVSGKDESEINLSVELLMASYLKSLGAEVTVTREQNDVNISNKERAELAVSKEPDLYIRLFCNAANDSVSKGCEVIVPSSGKYASEVKTWGDSLGKKLEEITLSTFNGCKASGNYSGLNWADSVPSFMIRMGYLSNSDDEALLLSEEYQFKICKGVAEFIATMPKK